MSEEQKEAKQWEDQREAMYYGSLKMRLVKPREIVTTVYDAVTLEEFRQIMIEFSPTAIYNTQWSEKKALYTINKRIYPSDEGITFVCNSWAEKTPKFKTFEQFYYMILSEGMEYIKF